MGRKKQTQMIVKGTKPTSGATELQPKEVEVDMQTITGVPPASPVQEPNPTTNTKSSSRKKAGKTIMFVRRSPRINTFTGPVYTERPLELTVERALEDVVVSDSEEEDELEEPQTQMISLEEKVDHPAQLVSEPQEIRDELKESAKNDNCGVNDLSYKSLYFDSQKKVEALMEEKIELSKKLENAYGKIEVFEKFKDMMMLSLLSKNTEPAAKLSFEAIRGAFNVGQEGRTSPKRKRTS